MAGSIERNMAENPTGVTGEVVQPTNVPDVVVVPEAIGSQRPGILGRIFNRPKLQVLVRPGEQQVIANASLNDQDRLKAAQQFLNPNLTVQQREEQEKAILKAHSEGSGEPGKDKRPAGVGNYTLHQLGEKLDILEKAGFSKKQRFSLVKEGLVGVLPSGEFDASKFDPDKITDSTIKKIAKQVQKTGKAGLADEHLMTRIAMRIEGLIDGGKITNEIEAQNFLDQLDKWRIEALIPPILVVKGPERPWLDKSDFEKVIDRITVVEEALKTDPSKQKDLDLARKERDDLLDEANKQGWFDDYRNRLSSVYYGSRVKVTNSEKEGREEFQGHGKLQILRIRKQEAADPSLTLEADRTIKKEDGSSETRLGFWSTRPGLAEKYGGIIDYFNEKSTDIILQVVEDRKKIIRPEDTGIPKVWKGQVIDVGGHAVKDEEGKEVAAQDFEDFRGAIEEQRRLEPWVPNRSSYETYIKFVADNVEELEEMIPYIVTKVQRKLGTGLPEQLHNKLGQEKEKIDAALVDFHVESESEFRRLKSTLADNLNLMGAYFFSDKVRIDWGPYSAYMMFLAEATQNTEQQDHLVDALILDRDGMIMLAAQQFLVKDGEFWRYGQKDANLAKGARDMNKLYRWQIRRKNEITKFLMTTKLKKMSDLLNLTVDKHGNITAIGDPSHPAFQRLKVEFDKLDDVDKAASNDILDVDDKPTKETRWEEYCKHALEWQRTGKFGDPRDAKRVLFQHPLARSFIAPTKTVFGPGYSEFINMFEYDNQVDTDRSYRLTKKRRVNSRMVVAERLCRGLMLDSTAALAWHTVKAIDPKATGDELTKEKARVDKELAEINKYLEAAGEDPIKENEAVPQKTLYRALMQALIREDQTKLPKDRMFKMYDVLTNLLGIDIDIPTSAAWYIGSHDTTRPTLLLAAIEKDTRPGSLKEAMPAIGLDGKPMDEKNTGAMNAETERRLGILTLMVMKAKFGGSGRYFNFPGHDTRSAGVKDVRNYLNLVYGTSKNTVWLNDLLDKIAIPLEQDWIKNYGATRDPITQLVGLEKGGNEVVFAQTGYEGIIENPRDFVSWVKRTVDNVEQSKTITSGNKEHFAVMKDGPLSGGYLWRDFNLGTTGKYINGDHEKDPYYAIYNPTAAIENLKESTKRAGIDLAAKVINPTVILMKGVVESTFGPNPGAAKFARTLIWYGISKWMDTSWEFRSKPSYATDANLVTARYFMHQYLLEYGENGLIYDDAEWDRIMLGYIRGKDGKANGARYEVIIDGKDGNEQKVKNSQGDWITEKIKDHTGTWAAEKIDLNGTKVNVFEEGLIDAFPKALREEILQINGAQPRYIPDFKGTEKYKGQTSQTLNLKDYILPFGLNSVFPETWANLYRDNATVQKVYGPALQAQTRPRTAVTRP